MIRMTEPMPCPRCRRPVVPGEERWYDEDGQPHVCEGGSGSPTEDLSDRLLADPEGLGDV
jgi:hypothetical protein